jgi:hypothetical protein
VIPPYYPIDKRHLNGLKCDHWHFSCAGKVKTSII